VCRCRNRALRVARLTVAALGALATASCGLVDLREVPVSTDPSRSGAVLDDSRYAVSAEFGAAMEQDDAEKAFSVESEDGAVEGDFFWSGKTLAFLPVDKWKPGVRYRLVLKGTIKAKDGREARPDIDLPFYALRGPGAPIVASFTPADGASILADPDRGAYVELVFSEAMDRQSAEDAFSLSPSAELDFSWNAGGTVLRATPKEDLSVCASYRWTIGTEALAADWAPLARSEAGRFATDGDAVPPRVVRTFAAARLGASWVEAGPSLADIPPGGAFGVEFSEAMDDASARRSLSFSPALSGAADRVDARRYVYVPDAVPEAGTEYVLTVSADAEDEAGLSMGNDYAERFAAPDRTLRVLSVETSAGERYDVPSGTPVGTPSLEATIGAPDGLLGATIRFSAALSAEARIAAVSDIALDVFFPATLAAPDLRSASWSAADTITLVWEGLEASTAEYERYYRLVVSGGSGGVGTGDGSVMEADFALVVETMP
jgi:hypothetical protein